MASTQLASFVIVFIIALNGFGSAIRVRIEPQPFDAMTDNELNITCTGAGPAYWAKTVLNIQIIKQGQIQPIININNMQGLTMGAMSKDNMKAEGQISKDASKSFLTLTIVKPGSEDTGSYSCHILFLNEQFQTTTEHTTSNVTFDEQAIKDIVTNLMEKVSGLMQDVREQREVISQQKDTIHGQEQQLIVFKNYHSKQERRYDALTDLIQKQINDTNLKRKNQVDVLYENNGKQDEMMQRQEHKLDELEDIVDQQNKTILRHKQQWKELKEESSKIEQQLGNLIGDDSRQQRRLGMLEDLINKQNDTIERLKSHVVLMHTQAYLDKGWTFFEADQTYLKAFGLDDSAKRLPWSKSREACQNLGGDLVQIRNEETNTFVFKLTTVFGNKVDAWIGIRQFDNGFEYVDGSPLTDSYQSWMEGEPNNFGGNEDCVVLVGRNSNSGQWNDQTCLNSLSYMCSIPFRGSDIF